jgi:hypothetical protein
MRLSTVATRLRGQSPAGLLPAAYREVSEAEVISMTRISRVIIGAHEFYLAPDASARKLSATIADVLHAGGGMVTLPTHAGREITALISPGVAVFVEEFERADDTEFEDEDVVTGGFDYDDYQGT